MATGAAVACPDRPVLSLEADGSAMYTIQSLWTQARESLDVTTVIMNNRSYAILNIELARTGAGAGGPKARDLLDLSRPDLDFVRLAEGMGVPAVAVRTAEDAVTRSSGRSPSPGRTSSTPSSTALIRRPPAPRRIWARSSIPPSGRGRPGSATIAPVRDRRARMMGYANGADRFRRQ